MVGWHDCGATQMCHAGVAQSTGQLVPAIHSHLPLAGGPCTDSALNPADLPLWRVHSVCAPPHLARPSLECGWVTAQPTHLLDLHACNFDQTYCTFMFHSSEVCAHQVTLGLRRKFCFLRFQERQNACILWPQQLCHSLQRSIMPKFVQCLVLLNLSWCCDPRHVRQFTHLPHLDLGWFCLCSTCCITLPCMLPMSPPPLPTPPPPPPNPPCCFSCSKMSLGQQGMDTIAVHIHFFSPLT